VHSAVSVVVTLMRRSYSHFFLYWYIIIGRPTTLNDVDVWRSFQSMLSLSFPRPISRKWYTKHSCIHRNWNCK